jgi:cell wall-associated NlpC family hydrolase
MANVLNLGIDDIVQALSGRLGGSLSGASPFQSDPRAAFSPFSAATLGGTQSPFRGGLSAQSPFQNAGMGGTQTPFAGRGFNVQSPFQGLGFNVQNPFGMNPIGQVPIFNPFAPKPAANQPGQSTGGVAGTASSGLSQGVAKWADMARTTFGDLGADIPDVMLAIMTNESGGDPNAYNTAGNAWGLFQQVGLGSNDPNVQFTAAKKLAQDKLASIASSYARNGLNPDTRTRALDLALAWAGHFDYDTGRANPTSTDIGSGQTAAQLSAVFLKNYDAIKAGRAQTVNGGLGGGQAGTNGVRFAGAQAVQRAQTLLGTPYVLGGLRGHPNNPSQGLDCSEFTGWALGLDPSLWHAQTQYDKSQHLTQQQAQAGDLVFFTATDPSNPNEYVTHVGLYLGNGRFINAQDGGVMNADLSNPYWQQHLAGFGRL